VIFYLWPELRLKDKVSQRRDGADRELPFFSILVHVLGSAGVDLYTMLVDVVNTSIFRSIRNEALLVKRDVQIFGQDPTEALESLATYHPSKKLAMFLNGYAAKVRSGGDIPTYLSSQSGSFLRELEEGWARYASRAGLIGGMMITLFGILPMLLLVIGIFSPSTSVTSLIVFTGLGLPFFTIVLVFMAGRAQPVGEEQLSGNPRRSLLLCLPGLVVGYALSQIWLGLASSLFIFFTVYGYSVMEQRREMGEIEAALPGFLADLMEFKRQEYDLTRAILAIAARNKYTPTFDRLISQVATQLKVGTPLNEAEADPRGRLGRVVFFVLGQMSLSGGGTVDTYYQLSNYATKGVEMKSNTRAEMRTYMYLSYVAPVMIAGGVAFIGSVIGQFGGVAGPALSALHASLGTEAATAALKQVSGFLIVAASGALGIISAKLVDFTVRNTLRASLNVVIATLATFAFTVVNLGSFLHP